MCEELRADLCQIKNEQKETQNQVYLLEATIRKLREDNFEAEMLQVELKSERDLALEQAKNAQVNTFKGSMVPGSQRSDDFPVPDPPGHKMGGHQENILDSI